MPETRGIVHVNEGVTNDIYFMDYFFEKMGQAQNGRKNCIYEKGSSNSIF